MPKIRDRLKALIDTGNELSMQINNAMLCTSLQSLNFICNNPQYTSWLQGVGAFNHKYLKSHAAHNLIKSELSNNANISNVLFYLNEVYNDYDFWDSVEAEDAGATSQKDLRTSKYDVFISHANADKIDFVDDLASSLKKLGILIFYDKDTLEWGDKWKDKILDGVRQAEFAIIVISENFFDREWTEKELNEFLHRQNNYGQKIILPILHNITIAQLNSKYPDIADIQAVESAEHSCDEIALLFARQLIKRLKG